MIKPMAWPAGLQQATLGQHAEYSPVARASCVSGVLHVRFLHSSGEVS